MRRLTRTEKKLAKLGVKLVRIRAKIDKVEELVGLTGKIDVMDVGNLTDWAAEAKVIEFKIKLIEARQWESHPNNSIS